MIRAGTARLAAALLAALLATPVPAQPAGGEIAQLFAALEASGCRFYRNGTWYDAAQARAHPQRKHEALQKRQRVGSAEAFIERAASRSSVSGKPYLVHCGTAAPVESQAWFLRQLTALRKAR